MVQTTANSLTETALAEMTSAYIKAYGRPDPLAAQVAWRRRSQLNVSTPFLRWEDTDLSSLSKSEGDNADEIQMQTNEATATPAIVSFEVALTDEAKRGAVEDLDIMERLVEEAIMALRNLRDSDILAVSTGATQFTGATTDPLTEDAYYSAIGTYRGLDPVIGPEGAVVILGNQAASDLRRSTQLSSAGSRVMDPFGKGPIGSPVLGELGGALVLESSNVAVEGSGLSNIITSVGQGSGLGLAWAPGEEGEEIQIEVNRGEEGARRGVTFMVFRMDYAAVLTDARGLVELLSA